LLDDRLAAPAARERGGDIRERTLAGARRSPVDGLAHRVRLADVPSAASLGKPELEAPPPAQQVASDRDIRKFIERQTHLDPL